MESVPNDFICPLTKLIFKDPVIADDEVCYERSAIIDYLNNHKNYSPIIKKIIEPKTYRIPIVRKMIDEYLIDNPQYKIYQFSN